MSAVQTSPDALFRHAALCALNTGLVKEGDLVVLTGSSEVGKTGKSTPCASKTFIIENKVTVLIFYSPKILKFNKL